MPCAYLGFFCILEIFLYICGDIWCRFDRAHKVSYRKPLATALIPTTATAVIVLQTQEDQSWKYHLDIGEGTTHVTPSIAYSKSPL